MRLTRGMTGARGTLGGLAGERYGLRLPVVEAVPAELVGGANLVGEAECIHPPFLFRPPPAIPRKLNHTGLSTALDHRGPAEIGAARTGVHLNSVDHPLRMGMEQLVDEPDDLDPRHGAHERDGRHIRARGEGNDVVLEAIGCAGARQDFGVDWHGRNISKDRCRPNTSFPAKKTKLTGESALARRGGFRQW